MSETQDVKYKRKGVHLEDVKLEPVSITMPENKKHPEDRTGSLQIYLTILPGRLDDKPRRVKLAEYHEVTERGARDWLAEFEFVNGFKGKQLNLSAIWVPYPVYL